jgi:hypothetical protein
MEWVLLCPARLYFSQYRPLFCAIPAIAQLFILATFLFLNYLNSVKIIAS